MKYKLVPALLALFATLVCAQKAAPSPFVFENEVKPLGKLVQGEKIKIRLHGKNASAKAVVLENVISQNSGPEDFRFPKQIAAGHGFDIDYTLNTAYMEGPFTHTIVLIDTAGKPYTTYVEGEVAAPIFFSEKLLDLGYYKTGQNTEWTVYAWNPGKKPIDLELTPESAKEFSAEIVSVSLHTDQLDSIREGGTVPGVKILLKAKNLGTPTGKSIRKLVSFRSKTYPTATPELLVVGYWAK